MSYTVYTLFGICKIFHNWKEYILVTFRPKNCLNSVMKVFIKLNNQRFFCLTLKFSISFPSTLPL